MDHIDFKERRSFLRFPVSIPATYIDPNFNTKLLARTKDICVEGVGLITDRGLVPGESLDLSLQMIDNGEKIYRSGKVIWSSMIESGKYRAGLKLRDSNLKPIPLVLRTIRARRQY